MAFSTPSAPVLTKKVFLAKAPGVMRFIASARRTYGSFMVTWKQEWVNFSACCCTARTTSFGAWPVFRTPMPAAKSRKRLPSTSSRIAPSPRAITTGVMLNGPRGIAASRAFISSCDLGPGTGVLRTTYFLTVTPPWSSPSS
jgi:hypothetical protein